MSKEANRVWKVMLVGVAGRGWWIVRKVQSDPRLQAVALVDRDQSALAHAGNFLEMPEAMQYSDLRRALEETRPDFAVICTPMITHADLCRIAFEFGVHVLVEKGMTFSWEESKMMVAAGEAAGVRFCVAQNFRYKSSMRTIEQILSLPDHESNPGRVFLVDYIQHRNRSDPRTSTYPFAMVWDMGCHHFDLLLSWFGPLKKVSARSYRAPWSRYEYPSNLNAFLEFESGPICNYVLTHDALFANTNVLLQGDRGVLRYGDDVEGVQFYPPSGQDLVCGKPRSCEVIDTADDLKVMLDEFLKYLETGEEPGISGRRNLETMAACALVVKAATEGRSVERAELT